MPGFELAAEHQVWELWAEWSSTTAENHLSRWTFVTLRELGTDQQGLFDRWDDHCRPYYIDWRPNHWQLKRVFIRDVWPGVQADWEHVYPDDLFGPHTGGPPAAAAATPLLIWTTEYHGRSYYGRTYWGLVREDQTFDDLLESETTDTIGLFSSAMSTFFRMSDPLFPHLPAFVILSRQLDGEPRDPPWVSGVEYGSLMRFLRYNRKRRNRDPLSTGPF